MKLRHWWEPQRNQLSATSGEMVFKGHLILDDGDTIKTKSELMGADGQNGTIWGTLVLRDGVFPSDALATADFTSRYGRAPILDDMLTYVSDDGSVSSVKTFDGTNWTTAALRLNGNLITPGTIFGDRIVAGSELSSPVIRGGYGYFGDNGSGGYYTTIDNLGNFTTSKLTATYGSIDNVTIGENCDVLGTIYAKNIEGDVSRTKVLKITTDTVLTVAEPSSGTNYAYLTLGQLDFGTEEFAREVVFFGNVMFDNDAAAQGAINFILNGSTVVTYQSSGQVNVYEDDTDGWWTYPSVFTIPANVSGLVTVQLEASKASNTSTSGNGRNTVLAGNSFIFTAGKS